MQCNCELYFNSAKSNVEELIKISLNTLGFTPTAMTIYINWDELYEDVVYDEIFLYSLLSQNPISIEIRNQVHDELDENLWFRIKNEDKFISLIWSNNNFDFLLTEKSFQLIKMKGFIAGYIYNNEDASNQTSEAKTSLTFDANKYPGQIKYVCGMQFMAAPLMWFGEPFFEIISKDELQKFKKARKLNADLIEIKLFDIYDLPQKTENRNSQKEFWISFELDKVVDKYQKENDVDAVQALNDFLVRMKLKKKK